MLPADARLAKSSGFRAAYSKGRSSATDLIVVYVLARPSGTRVRFGFAAGKKVGGAVQRNRAKRHMREAARVFLPSISGRCDIVVGARRPIAEAPFAEVRNHLERLLRRAGVIPNTGD